MLLSLLIVLAMGLGLVLFVWGVFTALPVVNRVVTRSFWCRFRKRNVSAEFQEDPLERMACRDHPLHRLRTILGHHLRQGLPASAEARSSSGL
jgi:hypothetical protein